MNKYNELLDILVAAKEDFEKFYDKGVKKAGTRVRKAMSDLRAKTKEIRKDVSEVKGARAAAKEAAKAVAPPTA